MATKTKVVIVDDLDGSAADETVEYGLDGVTYQIDLCQQNAIKFRDMMQEWIDHSRRTGGRRTVGTKSKIRHSSKSSRIRQWARQQGLSISERGRIPAEVLAQYAEEHR